MNNTPKATNVAVVNKQQIIFISKDGRDYVPIRPICDALGVDFSAQLQRIKRDPIFSSGVVTVTTTGADGKQYEMVALDSEFSSGWLFTIDTNLVKEEIKSFVIEYKRECNRVLHNHFKSYADFANYRSEKMFEADAIVKACRVEFNTAKDKIKDAEDMKAKAYGFTYQDWIDGKRQLEFNFTDQEAAI